MALAKVFCKAADLCGPRWESSHLPSDTDDWAAESWTDCTAHLVEKTRFIGVTSDLLPVLTLPVERLKDQGESGRDPQFGLFFPPLLKANPLLSWAPPWETKVFAFSWLSFVRVPGVSGIQKPGENNTDFRFSFPPSEEADLTHPLPNGTHLI